jgi:hypothetical protein
MVTAVRKQQMKAGTRESMALDQRLCLPGVNPNKFMLAGGQSQQ